VAFILTKTHSGGLKICLKGSTMHMDFGDGTGQADVVFL